MAIESLSFAMPICKAPLPKTAIPTKADKHLATVSANHPSVVAPSRTYRVTPRPLIARSSSQGRSSWTWTSTAAMTQIKSRRQGSIQVWNSPPPKDQANNKTLTPFALSQDVSPLVSLQGRIAVQLIVCVASPPTKLKTPAARKASNYQPSSSRNHPIGMYQMALRLSQLILYSPMYEAIQRLKRHRSNRCSLLTKKF